MTTTSNAPADRPPLVFSVDVEDWGQSVFDRTLPIGEHCGQNVLRLLEGLAEVPDARGTFFVLGKFAVKHPAVVRRIHDAGHEVACHGFGHVVTHCLSPPSFREDVRRAADELARITGCRPLGFRAPVFSITAGTLWALDIVAEEGFRYDSSIYPFAGRRYGLGNWPLGAVEVALRNAGRLIEYPPTVIRVLGRRLPVSGGGYARLLPRSLLLSCLRRAARSRPTWPVFYCHPYEIDPNEFRRRSPAPPWGERRVPLGLRLHQGLGRRGFAGKLRALGAQFRLHSFDQALAVLSPLPLLKLGEADSLENGTQPALWKRARSRLQEATQVS